MKACTKARSIQESIHETMVMTFKEALEVIINEDGWKEAARFFAKLLEEIS
jgi:hypothetical protein